MDSFERGEHIIRRWELVNEEGAAVDGTAVSELMDPSGTVTNPPTANPQVGRYEVVVAIPDTQAAEGRWRLRTKWSGATIAAKTVEFLVLDSPFPPS